MLRKTACMARTPRLLRLRAALMWTKDFILCLVLIATSLEAGAITDNPGEYRMRAVQPPQSASERGLVAHILLVTHLAAFVEMWARPEPPRVVNVRSVRIGESLAAVILYGGARAGRDGNCNVTYVIEVKRPAGEVRWRSTDQPLCDGHPPANTTGLSLADTATELITEGASEVLVVMATITDRNAGITLTISAPLTLAPSNQ